MATKHLKAILSEMEQKLGRDDPGVVDVRWQVMEGETMHRAQQALTRTANAGVPVVQLEFDVHERIVSLLERHEEQLQAWRSLPDMSDIEARHAAVLTEIRAFRAVLMAVHEALPEMLLHSDDVIGQILDMLSAAWQIESNHFGRT